MILTSTFIVAYSYMYEILIPGQPVKNPVNLTLNLGQVLPVKSNQGPHILWHWIDIIIGQSNCDMANDSANRSDPVRKYHNGKAIT